MGKSLSRASIEAQAEAMESILRDHLQLALDTLNTQLEERSTQLNLPLTRRHIFKARVQIALALETMKEE